MRKDSVKIKGLQTKVFTVNTIMEKQKRAIKDGLIEREKLRKLHIKDVRTNTVIKANIAVLKKQLANPNVIYDTIRETMRPTRMMKLPAIFNYKDDYVNLKVTIDTTWSFKLRVPVDLDVTVGQKVNITTNNPYVEINKIKSVVVPQKGKRLKNIAIGTVIGLAIAGIISIL